MDAKEREFVLKHLCDSRDCVVRSAVGLSKEQAAFRTAADQWSVADCIEHIDLVENRVLSTIQRMLQEEPPETIPDVQGKLERMLTTVADRSRRVKAPEPLVPQGAWTNFSEVLDRFQTTRERTLLFAAGTHADLHGRFFPHITFKELDCYQWLVFLGLHCERHVRQLEEVKAAAEFPKGR